MGLSRNKVAVSEGAAGSPPFYGENAKGAEALVATDREKRRITTRRGRGSNCCSVFSVSGAGALMRKETGS